MAIIQHLLVDEFGSFVGKHSERVQVTKKDSVLTQAPLIHLETITIANQGVSLSAEMVRECAERGIPIFFVSGTGTAYASLYSAGLTGTVLTRRAQLQAFTNGLGWQFACSAAAGKIHNQAQLLKYMGKYRKSNQPELFAVLQNEIEEINAQTASIAALQRRAQSEEDPLQTCRDQLMGIEGYAAQRYWSAVGKVIPPELGWSGRIGRGATDPFNSALNYGYGILYGQIERALVLAGLDPFAGFLHVDRPGKPSLTLDMIEEFRQAVVDRTVIGMVNKGVELVMEDGLLSKSTRRTLAEKVLARLDTAVRYEQKQFPLRHILQSQARKLAQFVRGENPTYVPFSADW